MRGREEYREFHERDYEHGEAREVPEVDDDPGDCPKCRWDEVCKGGCRVGVDCGFKFEKIKEEI